MEEARLSWYIGIGITKEEGDKLNELEKETQEDSEALVE